MSLTYFISHAWKEFFQENIPEKKEFMTVSGKEAFSSQYMEKAPYRLTNSYLASTIGTAFDYMARWIVAAHVEKNRESSYENLVAAQGLSYCRYISRRAEEQAAKEYRKGIRAVKGYIKGKITLEELARTAVFFAKLEQFYRSSLPPFNTTIEEVFEIKQEIIDELILLCRVFEDTFINSGLIKATSTVIYNPTFGMASVACGGADADIYIDGTLYDFKSSKKRGYTWKDTAQILGYYLLDCVSKRTKDETSELMELPINRIAIYQARYGEIAYVDVSMEAYHKCIISFRKMLNDLEYEKLLNRHRKEVLEEERQQKLREEKYRKWKQKYQEELKEAESKSDELMVRYLKVTHYECDYFKCFESLSKSYNNRFKECRTEKERRKMMQEYVEYAENTFVYGKIKSVKMKSIMKKNNISIQDICNHTGVRPATVKNWMTGKSTPRVGRFIRLMEILNCSREELLK